MAIAELTATKTKLITGAELERMGDIGPCELVEGRIVSMSPTSHQHGEVETNFAAALHTYTRTHKVGKVQSGEVGIYTERNPDTVRGVDVLFISNERFAQQKSPGFLEIAPDLVVEVLSPGNSWSEIMQKLREYLAIGVRLVWIADPETRHVYAYRALTDMREFAENDDLPGDDVLPGFSVPVARLFES
jgi:Uma2 family endonuclease